MTMSCQNETKSYFINFVGPLIGNLRFCCCFVFKNHDDISVMKFQYHLFIIYLIYLNICVGRFLEIFAAKCHWEDLDNVIFLKEKHVTLSMENFSQSSNECEYS